MKIYIASSWKNQHAVELLTEKLEVYGHIVISFVREAAENEDRNEWNYKDFTEWIWSENGAQKFKFDLDGATKSDLLIYISPSGTDAWAEVGAAWASGVTIYGLYAKGETAGLTRRMVTKWFKDYKTLLEEVLYFAQGVD